MAVPIHSGLKKYSIHLIYLSMGFAATVLYIYPAKGLVKIKLSLT